MVRCSIFYSELYEIKNWCVLNSRGEVESSVSESKKIVGQCLKKNYKRTGRRV